MSKAHNKTSINNHLGYSTSLHQAFPGLALVTILALGSSTTAVAQDEQNVSGGGSQALLEEIKVTARKREEGAQTVPVSITAYGSDQLEALKIRDLQDLSVAMPNVAMDDIGTFRSTANFSIRGLGINSSIPSIDPTVGVFVDGVYIGQNSGVILDMFDIRSIEVLRGPPVKRARQVTDHARCRRLRPSGRRHHIR